MIGVNECVDEYGIYEYPLSVQRALAGLARDIAILDE